MHLHDSHSAKYRWPLGGVKAGDPLTLRFYCDESELISLRTWDGAEHRYPMEALGANLFQVTVTVPQTPMLFWYDFIIHRPEGDLRYGNAYDRLGGAGADYVGQPHSFQVTVYDPEYATPEYLRTGVIYQIFPDRFFKDVKEFDSKQRREIAKAHPDATLHRSWKERPTLDPDPLNGDNRAHDFFGGTLAGIVDKLDYLQALGVSVIYLNPVFRSSTNHRYATGDYEHVDPYLGTDEDFAALCKAAKKCSMRVMLDGVFSHTGDDSRYFNRYGRYDSVGAYQSESSPYAGWYTFDSFPDRYDCWWNFYTLPAVRKDNPDYRKYLLARQKGVLPLWMRRGACGWRLDVADELPMDLIREMRASVKRQNADGVLLGEVWEDASNKVAYGELRSYCLGDMLDSVMNYPLRRAVIDFFTGHCDAYQLVRLLLHQREVYPTPFYYSMMNLLGSHDRVRILNAMAGYDRSDAEQPSREVAERLMLTDEQLSLAKDRYLEAMRLLCALPGAPTVYYGDEIGMQGMADPWNRAPMEWKNGDAVLWSNLASLLNHRRLQPILQLGLMDAEAVDADTLVIRRFTQNGKDAFDQPLNAPDVSVTITRRESPVPQN